MSCEPGRSVVNAPVASGAWPIVGLAVLVTVPWMAAAGLSLQWRSTIVSALLCLGLEGLSAFYRSKRQDVFIPAALSLTAQLVVFTATAACLSYAVAATGGALWDSTFMVWDGALGLDWRGYLAFLDARPRLSIVLALFYQTLLPQMVVVIAVLGLGVRTRAAQEFVIACVLAALATDIVSGLMPAMGTYAHLGLKPQDFPHLDPVAAYLHIPALTGLRDGTFRVLALDKMEGIITFPSFHAVLGVLFIRAFWSVPWLRWPAVVVNTLLIVATPIEGGHYFADVIAGIVIAGVAILAAAKLTRTSPEQRGSRVSPVISQTGLGV